MLQSANRAVGRDRHEMPGLRAPTDLADVWLIQAFEFLLDACDIPESEWSSLVDSGAESPPDAPVGETAAERLDASRHALVFAALAVESRLNRVVARCDPPVVKAVAHLVPADRFVLALSLLDEPEAAREHVELRQAVAELFEVRDTCAACLEHADPSLVEAAGLTVGRVRALVEASARICNFLATLTPEHESATDELVAGRAAALVRRAERLSVEPLPDLAHLDWDWLGDTFPPNLIGS